MAGPGHFAVLSALVFAVGLFGVIAHASTVRALIALAVLFTSPLIALIGFAQTGLGNGYGEPAVGGLFAVLALLSITAELVAALGVAVLLWRRTGSADIDDPALGEPV